MVTLNSHSVDSYIKELQQEFPKLKIHKNKPWWLKFIYNLPGLKKMNWGNATQCIGSNIYLSNAWDTFSPMSQLSTLRHERQHVIWFKRHTTLLASILYLFFIFPIGLAYYRARFERAGYKENVKLQVECYGNHKWVKDSCRRMYLDRFTGWTYLKMWPFEKTILKWFKEDWEYAIKNLK